MYRKKIIKAYILLIIFLVGCIKVPRPCFTEERIGLNKIRFDASCSENGVKFHWKLGIKDTITESPIFEFTFPNSGEFFIILKVENKNGRKKSILAKRENKFYKSIIVN